MFYNFHTDPSNPAHYYHVHSGLNWGGCYLCTVCGWHVVQFPDEEWHPLFQPEATKCLRLRPISLKHSGGRPSFDLAMPLNGKVLEYLEMFGDDEYIPAWTPDNFPSIFGGLPGASETPFRWAHEVCGPPGDMLDRGSFWCNRRLGELMQQSRMAADRPSGAPRPPSDRHQSNPHFIRHIDKCHGKAVMVMQACMDLKTRLDSEGRLSEGDRAKYTPEQQRNIEHAIARVHQSERDERCFLHIRRRVGRE